MNKLTDLKARNIKPSNGPIADGIITGLRLMPGKTNGQGKWEMRFVSPINHKRRDMGFGIYPGVTIIEAREQASEAHKMIRQGKDPIDERKAVKLSARLKVNAMTFKCAAEAVFKSRKDGFSNPKHSAQWIQTLRTYAFSKLETKKVEELSPSDFADILRPIWLNKAETASRVKQRCDAVMEWCIAKELIISNPVKSVSTLLPKQPGKRERVTRHPSMPWQDLPDFVATILNATNKPSLGAMMLEFLILTAARSGEVRLMQWEEIDFETCLWTVPAERMKARIEHRVPLSKRALRILQNQKKKAENTLLVFPTIRGKVATDMIMTKLLRSYKIKSDIKGRVATAHGFRSSFRNWASETGCSREIAERALSHTVRNAVEAAYLRTDLLDKRRIIMDSWANFVSKKNSNTAKVVNLKG